MSHGAGSAAAGCRPSSSSLSKSRSRIPTRAKHMSSLKKPFYGPMTAHAVFIVLPLLALLVRPEGVQASFVGNTRNAFEASAGGSGAPTPSTGVWFRTSLP